MKKRIIAALLVLVMSVLALASCGFDLAEDDLSVYTDGTFNVADFMKALSELEIEDGEYTTDKATNDKVIASDIYEGIATGIINSIGKPAEDDDAEGKLEDGVIGATDVVYYCYYITYTKDGVTHEFKRSELDEAQMKKSTVSASHVIKLGSYKGNDKFAEALYNALAGKTLVPYSTDSTKEDVKKGSTIAVSYTVKGVGEGAVTKSASYEFLDLTSNKPLAKALNTLFKEDGKIVDKGVFTVDSSKTVQFPSGSSSTPEITVDLEGGGQEKYSDIKVHYVVDKKGEEITFDYTLDSLLGTLEFDELHNTAADKTLTLDKDTKVTYHILPVYRVEVPESNAANIIEYVYGSKLSSWLEKASSDFAYGSSMNTALNEILNDAEFKLTEGEGTDATTKTSKEIIDVIAKLWKGDYTDFEDIKALVTASDTAQDAYEDALTAEETAKKAKENAEKAEADAKKAWENAAAEDKDAKEAAYKTAQATTAEKTSAYTAAQTVTDEKEALADTAKEEITTAQKAEIKKQIAKLITAKKSDKALGDELNRVLDEELRHSRKENYDNDISEKIKKAVYAKIDEMVKVTSYPEDLEKEFYKKLYDNYENTFYNGNYSSTQTNFVYYGGDFTSFLKAQTKATDKEGIEKAIMKEAQGYIEPLIKIYVVAQALDEYDFSDYNYGKTADDVFTKFVQMDIEDALPSYKAYYFDDENLSDKENEKLKEKNEENAEAIREGSLENAKHFLMDKEGFKALKKRLGAKSYRYQEEEYDGELNLRANVQLNNLFDLLLSTNNTVTVDTEDEHVHTQVDYVKGEGDKLFHDYRLITYKFTEK